MKKILVFSFALSLILGFAGLGGIAHGTLIGNTVLIEHHWPGFDNISHRTTKKVVEGSCEWSYVVEEHNGQAVELYTLDIEAHSIRIDFPIGYQWADWEWNGLVIRNLAWIGNPDDWKIKTNLEGWDTFKHLYYGKDYVAFNFQALGSPSFYPADSYLELQMSAPFPVFKYSSMLLIATGLVGLVGFRKKLKKKTVKPQTIKHGNFKHNNLKKKI